MMNNMAQSCLQGGVFMGLVGILVLAFLGLGVAALAKYLFWSPRHALASGDARPGTDIQRQHEGRL